MGKFKQPTTGTSSPRQKGPSRIPAKILEDPIQGSPSVPGSTRRLLTQAVETFESDPLGPGVDLILSRIRSVGLKSDVAHLRGIIGRIKKADSGKAEDTLQALEERVAKLDSDILDAACDGYLENAETLLSNGADALARDESGRTTLMWACKNNRVPMAVRMMDLGVDVNAVDNNQWTALMYTASNGSYEAADLLLDNLAIIDAVNVDRETAARLAYDRNQKKVYELLIRCGATDPRSNIVDLGEYRKKDLDIKYLAAAEKGDTEEVEKLVKDGADINVRGRHNNNGLMFALEYQRESTALLLIKLGIDLNAKNDFDMTALMLALDNQLPSAALRLLDGGVDVLEADHHGRTTLMRAAFWDETYIAECILDRNADPNAQDMGKNTALFDAVSRNNLETAGLLLQRRADPNVENDEYETPLELARRKRHSEMALLLKEYGAMERKPSRRVSTRFALLAMVLGGALSLGVLYYIKDHNELKKAEQVVTSLSQQPRTSPDDFKSNKEHLIKALESGNDTVRRFAASYLAGVKDERVVDPLIELLRDEAWGVQKAAAQSLQKMKLTKEQIGSIIYTLDFFGKKSPRLAAAIALREPEKIRILIKMNDIFALGKIAQLNPGKELSIAVPYSIECLKYDSPLPGVYVSAARILGSQKEKRGLDVLIRRFKTLEGKNYRSTFYEQFVWAFGEIGSPKAIPVLVKMLNGPYSSQVRISVIRAIGKIAEETKDNAALEPAISPLKRLSADYNDSVADEANRVLKIIDSL